MDASESEIFESYIYNNFLLLLFFFFLRKQKKVYVWRRKRMQGDGKRGWGGGREEDGKRGWDGGREGDGKRGWGGGREGDGKRGWGGGERERDGKRGWGGGREGDGKTHLSGCAQTSADDGKQSRVSETLDTDKISVRQQVHAFLPDPEGRGHVLLHKHFRHRHPPTPNPWMRGTQCGLASQ